jgi:uncharacterized protein (TIGR01244 family)
MKKLILVFTSSILFACMSQATEPTNDSTVSLSAAQIKADSSTLVDQQYVSTGQPDKEVLSIAKDAGFVAIVDLRGEGEDRGYDEVAAVEAMGMTYVALPVAGASDVTYENAARLDSILEGIDGPVLLHCKSGNRVGALIALRASVTGATDEEAIAAGKAAGLTRLEPVVQKLLAEDK